MTCEGETPRREDAKDIEARLAALERDSHPPLDLTAAMVEILASWGLKAPHGGDSAVKRFFVLSRRPGCVVVKSGPFKTRALAIHFIGELLGSQADAGEITLAALTWNDDLWVESGRDAWSIDRFGRL